MEPITLDRTYVRYKELKLGARPCDVAYSGAMAQIESPANPRIKALVRLRKRSERDKTGRFIIEGERELEAALESREVVELFVADGLLTGHGTRVVAQASAAGLKITTVAPPVLARVAYRGNPSGFIAVARQWEMPLDVIPVTDALILVVESIEKPGNLGGMLRSAEAAGASVIVASPTTDLFNSNVVRAAMGALFRVPLAVASTEDTLAWLSENLLSVYPMSPAAERALWDVDLTGPCALVVGGESEGLTEAWLEHPRVVIPMPGKADSLNASVSAAIGLFEAVRQRRRA